jgi:DNA-binding transcriptional ArsR family regulator
MIFGQEPIEESGERLRLIVRRKRGIKMGINTPVLTWEVGSAYDMFMSLHVLYNPDQYGLRGAWAAGVRSRLPNEEREFLQKAIESVWPIGWIHRLPAPQNGQTLLNALAALPGRERLPALCILPETYGQPYNDILRRVVDQGKWGDADYQALKATYRAHGPKKPKKKDLEDRLDLWARADEFGELILSGLQAYYEAFFAEEENRIRPALQAAAETGQKLAKKMPLVNLLEELAQGVRFESLPNLQEAIMVPSFWITPLVAEYSLSKERVIFLYGARPEDASLVPGEFVPDALYQSLKALADPTRLRILHYLTVEPLSPSKLAAHLRLRPPTVIHHLHILRLARLVHLTMGKEGKRRYTVRPGAVAATFAALEAFIEQDAVNADAALFDEMAEVA